MGDRRTRIALVVAVSRNGVIGRDGGLPWKVSGDLKKFKDVTLGKPIIMGRKTWESLPRKPLPGRLNIVLTRACDREFPGATVVSSTDAALQTARGTGSEEVCIIGGGEIYKSFFDNADRIYLTQIDIEVDGDTRFPADLSHGWRLVSREAIQPTQGDTAAAELNVYDRIQSVS